MSDTNTAAAVAELEPQVALDMLLILNGDMDLTVEKLGVSRAVFIKALTAVPAETFATMRIATALRAFDSMRVLGENLESQALEMDGADLARALQSMMGHVETLTRPQGPASGGGNVINVLLQHVPREAANAIKGMAAMDMDDLHDIRRLLQARASTAPTVEEGNFKEL